METMNQFRLPVTDKLSGIKARPFSNRPLNTDITPDNTSKDEVLKGFVKKSINVSNNEQIENNSTKTKTNLISKISNMNNTTSRFAKVSALKNKFNIPSVNSKIKTIFNLMLKYPIIVFVVILAIFVIFNIGNIKKTILLNNIENTQKEISTLSDDIHEQNKIYNSSIEDAERALASIKAEKAEYDKVKAAEKAEKEKTLKGYVSTLKSLTSIQ